MVDARAPGRHLSDHGQIFALEPERKKPGKLFESFNLAQGVGGKGQGQGVDSPSAGREVESENFNIGNGAGQGADDPALALGEKDKPVPEEERVRGALGLNGDGGDVLRRKFCTEGVPHRPYGGGDVAGR